MDEEETPPVPPMDPKGNERLGFWITGILFLVAGWGAGVFANLLLHRYAPASGTPLGPVTIYPGFGPFAWMTFILGFAAGLFGIVLLYLATRAPRGPAVLPGYPY